MDTDQVKSSSTRKWLLLLGAVIVFVVVFGWLERLGRSDSTTIVGANPAGDSGKLPSPEPPEVVRLRDGGIQIRHDFFRRTTIRLEDEESENALFDCLEQGIEQAFGGGTEGWNRGRVEREALQVQFDCLKTVKDVPLPPPPPEVPGN